ncbi:MAG: type IV pilus modification protein PilV [Sedimenticola sp.]|nr:type IV pilus modification protein PilV [Sedimenticola sp.]
MLLASTQRIIKRQSGMTLLEVLIALLVISVGLLGMAGLQVAGIKMTNDAYYRSQATWLAYDVYDRMRANLDQAANTNNYRISLTDSAPTASNCATTSCTAAQMVDYDLAAWKNTLAAKLPQGNGEILYQDTASGRTYTVAVQWDDSRGEAALKKLLIKTGL